MSWTDTENALQAWIVNATGLDADHVIWAEQSGPRPGTPFIMISMPTYDSNGRDWVDVEDNFLTIADDDVESVDDGANTLTLTAHGLLTGDGPVRFTTTGALPTPLAVDTDYFVIRVDDDTIKLATSFLDSLDGTAVALSDTGSGTHTLHDTATTTRSGEEIAHKARGPREASLSLQCFATNPTGVSRAAALLEKVRGAASLPTPRSLLKAAGIGIGAWEAITPISAVVGAAFFEPRAVTSVMLHLTAEATELGTYIETVEIEREIAP